MGKKEIFNVALIFLFVFLANFFGFRTSLKRQRDIQRILDIGKIESGLNRYASEFGSFPLSTQDGKMLACPGPLTGIDKTTMGVYKKPKLINLVACQWGKDSLWDAADINYPAYIDGLPADPQSGRNINYLYLSDGKSFQILASLELKEHQQFDREILKKKIKCGQRFCNFSRSGIVK